MREDVTTWIVTADGGRARVFERMRGGALQPLQQYDIDAERQNSPPPAKEPSRAGLGLRGAADQPLSDPEQRRFLAGLAGALDAAAKADRFERLVLLAPTRDLAVLRSMLDPKTALRIEAGLPQDRSSLAEEVLREALQAAGIAR